MNQESDWKISRNKRFHSIKHRNEKYMGMSNAKHRHVCDRCLTITKEIGHCPNCGHSELRPFIFFLQSGGKYQVANPNSVKQETA